MEKVVFDELQKAIEYVKNYDESKTVMEVAISDSLQDPKGTNMAILRDSILDKGYELNGYKQENGYRIYNYQVFEQ